MNVEFSVFELIGWMYKHNQSGYFVSHDCDYSQDLA